MPRVFVFLTYGPGVAAACERNLTLWLVLVTSMGISYQRLHPDRQSAWWSSRSKEV
jgi:hypothetical protein